MSQPLKQGPPPIPNYSDSEVDNANTLAVIALAIVLLCGIVVALLLLQSSEGGANASGDIAANSSGDGGQSDNATKGIGETNEDSGGDLEGSQTIENHADEEAPQDDANAEVASDSVEDAQANSDEQFLSPQNERQGAQSKRRVRNTLNPFGSTLPPKKPSQKVAPAEAGKSADFFGVEAEGKSFVYVVDKSSSMMMGKFDAAREELIQSIDSLRPNQKFFVIFFDSSYHTQPTKGLVQATFRNKKMVKEWMMRADPSAATEPYPAIEYAVELHPDAIYVLSDGEFDSSVVHQVSKINGEFIIPIHTIAFTSNAQTLKELADENKGTYRYVP